MNRAEERRARPAILNLRQLRAGLIQPAIGPGVVARHAAQMFEHHGGTASRRDAGQERSPAAHGQGPGQIRRGRCEPVGGTAATPADQQRSSSGPSAITAFACRRRPDQLRQKAFPASFSASVREMPMSPSMSSLSRSRARRWRARSCQASSCSTTAARRPSAVDHNSSDMDHRSERRPQDALRGHLPWSNSLAANTTPPSRPERLASQSFVALPFQGNCALA